MGESAVGEVPFAVRRSRHVVLCWDPRGLVAWHYARESRDRIDLVDIRILDAADQWIRSKDLADGRSDAEDRIRRLVDLGYLEVMGRPPDVRTVGYDGWGEWRPVAAFFHAATRDVRYVDLSVDCPPPIATVRSPPPFLKSYPNRPRLSLPAPDMEGGFPGVLLGRRTWRRFAEQPIALDDVATLLGLTWGVQGWLGAQSPVPVKTSPSGGARHSVEAYLLALNTEGVEPGLYHYAPDDHELVPLGGPVKPGELEALLPAQPWFHEAAAIVFMTSVFERIRWRYDRPRAYRVVTIELGHLAQTFCLLASARGLAPFCTAALGDTSIEALLGVDGVTESVLYAVGVGHRPEGVDRATNPWGTDELYPIRPPTWASGRDGAEAED